MPACRTQFRAPLRLFHLRRRLSRQSRPCAAGDARIRRTIHGLCRQRLRRRQAGCGGSRWRRMIAKAASIEAPIGGIATRIDTSTPSAKKARLRPAARLAARTAGRARLAARDRRTVRAPRRRQSQHRPRTLHVLGRTEDFADDPLVTIGAHTITHCNLAQAKRGDRRVEMAVSRRASKRPCGGRYSTSPIPMATGRGRPARIRARLECRLQDRGDDAARHDVCLKAPAISPRCRGSRSTAITRTRASCRCSPPAPLPRCGTDFAAWMRRRFCRRGEGRDP